MNARLSAAKLVSLSLVCSACASDECSPSSVELPGDSYTAQYLNWHPSGIRVRAGDRVRYRASGKVWDGTRFQSGDHLLARVEGQDFALVESETSEMPGSGTLFLSIDDNPTGSCNLGDCRGPGSCYCDNDGVLCLDIEHQSGSAGDGGAEN